MPQVKIDIIDLEFGVEESEPNKFSHSWKLLPYTLACEWHKWMEKSPREMILYTVYYCILNIEYGYWI